MKSLGWLWNGKVYEIGERFGRASYRTNIVRVEKASIWFWCVASVGGRILCMLWAVATATGGKGDYASWRLVVPGAMMWVAGEFFIRAANRGILYHHMDFLAEWLGAHNADRAIPTGGQRHDG